MVGEGEALIGGGTAWWKCFRRRCPAAQLVACVAQVCEELNCEEQVYPLAVNFLDRFLCVCVILRTQLQLASAVCLLLASKIRQSHALSVDLLCVYCDNSFTPDELRVSHFL